MTYATQQNLIDRFGQVELIQLTDRGTPPTNAIVSAVIDRALADADGEINAYVSAKYPLPLDPVPAVLERIACDIARYFLYDDRATEQVTQRYKDAIKFLQGVANGSASLGTDSDGDAPAAGGAAQYSAPTRVFTQDTLRDFG